jgi:hypothetical protein
MICNFEFFFFRSRIQAGVNRKDRGNFLELKRLSHVPGHTVSTLTGMPEREILLTQTLFCLQSNQNWPQHVPVFQSSVTEHVGVVMGKRLWFNLEGT